MFTTTQIAVGVLILIVIAFIFVKMIREELK